MRILNPIALATPIEVSDKYDGTDRRYHITAVALGVPQEAIVEAYALRGTTETTLGTLCPVPETADTFEGFWDIPDSFSEGIADLKVNVFDHPGDGAQVLASDQVRVDVQHLDGSTPASETVAIQWPLNDGPLGFYRNKTGEWKANVEGLGSTGASTFDVQYSTSPLDGVLSFKTCAPAAPGTPRTSDQARITKASCKLAAGDRPSAVTALAMAALKGGPESSDVHRVHPFVQNPSDMQVTLKEVTPPHLDATQPSGRRREVGGCLEFAARAVDQYGRPVVGANIDVELRGPSDSGSFADPVDATAPDKAAVTENAMTCGGAPHATFKQARSVVADGPDARAIESAAIGTTDTGEWRFKIFAAEKGISTLKAWVDDEPLESDISERPTDNDIHDSDEPFGTADAQWLEGAVKLEISPRDDAAPIGSCRLYRLRATGGSSVLAGFNIDLHIRQPDPQLRVCGPGSEALNPPDAGHAAGPSHPAETTGECPGKGLPCIHVEGVTDAAGELLFGLSSNVAGLATITAWADGEPGGDTDGFAFTKAQTTIVTNWVLEEYGPTIHLFGHPEATRISSDTFKVLARVGAPFLVQGVSISVSSTTQGGIALGKATRIGQTNMYEFVWNLRKPLVSSPAASPTPSGSPSASPSGSPSPSVTPAPSISTPVSPSPMPSVSLPPGPKVGVPPGVPDGEYTLTAGLDGGGSDSITVEVNRAFSPTADNNPPYEWAELTFPKNGESLGFVDGATTLEGAVGGEAEGVDLWYATVGTLGEANWSSCGYQRLSGLGTSESQFFAASCRLNAPDQPADVMAVGATAFDCTVGTTGCADPTPPPLAPGVPDNRRRTQRGAWEASGVIAVTGCDGSPCITLLPTRWRAFRDTCVPMSVLAAKLNKPAVGQAVVLEFQGPTDGIHFCDPLNTIDTAWPGQETVEVDPFGPDIHRILGKTDAKGVFSFGVYSADSNFQNIFSSQESVSSRLTAWADDGDALLEPGESKSSSVLHWELLMRCTIVGTDRPEVITGTTTGDVICGRGGDDVIYGLEGDDIVLGGPGNDLIHGDDGNDTIFGEAGNDTLFGGAGDDTIHGDDGDDFLHGGSGNDIIFGDDGNDQLFGEGGSDELDAGLGEDHCDLGRGRKNSAAACETVFEPEKRRKKRPRTAYRAY